MKRDHPAVGRFNEVRPSSAHMPHLLTVTKLIGLALGEALGIFVALGIVVAWIFQASLSIWIGIPCILAAPLVVHLFLCVVLVRKEATYTRLASFLVPILCIPLIAGAHAIQMHAVDQELEVSGVVGITILFTLVGIIGFSVTPLLARVSQHC